MRAGAATALAAGVAQTWRAETVGVSGPSARHGARRARVWRDTAGSRARRRPLSSSMRPELRRAMASRAVSQLPCRLRALRGRGRRRSRAACPARRSRSASRARGVGLGRTPRARHEPAPRACTAVGSEAQECQDRVVRWGFGVPSGAVDEDDGIDVPAAVVGVLSGVQATDSAARSATSCARARRKDSVEVHPSRAAGSAPAGGASAVGASSSQARIASTRLRAGALVRAFAQYCGTGPERCGRRPGIDVAETGDAVEHTLELDRSRAGFSSVRAAASISVSTSSIASMRVPGDRHGMSIRSKGASSRPIPASRRISSGSPSMRSSSASSATTGRSCGVSGPVTGAERRRDQRRPLRRARR